MITLKTAPDSLISAAGGVTGVVATMALPPLMGLVIGALGALVGVGSLMIALLSQPTPPTAWEIWRTIGIGGVAILMGAVSAWLIGEALMSLIPWIDGDMGLVLVQFAVGFLAWRAAPWVYDRAAREIKDRSAP